MKMNKTIYQELKNEMEELVNKDILKTLEYRQNVKFAKNQFHSFCWGIYWSVSKKIRNTIRNEKLYDNHIQTAITTILKQFENPV